MDIFLEWADKVFSNHLVQSVLVIAAGILLYKIISALLLRQGRKNRILKSGKGETYIRLTNSTMKYIILVITVLLLLQVNNVNVTSMIAGLGIVSIVLGLAVQDALQDIIRGFSIISDEYFHVGDVIAYNGIEGKVLELGLKTTKIRELKTDHILSIPNRSIESVELLSDVFFLNIPLPYELKLADAEEIINDMAKACGKSRLVKNVDNLGVNNLGDSAIQYLLRIQCVDTQFKFRIRRECLHAILKVMEEHSVSVPYNQLDVHTK